VIAAWQSWARTRPTALWSTALAAAPGGNTLIKVGGTYLGSVSGAANLLAQCTRRSARIPPYLPQQPGALLNAMLVEAGCSSIGSRLAPPWYAAAASSPAAAVRQSDFFTTR